MSDNLKAQASQVALLFVVFLLFMSNGTGLLKVQFNASSGLSIRSFLFNINIQEEIGRLSESFIKRGWPGPNMGMGIGINTGMMNVGNMGSKYRITYTVVGDAVNLAARMEALTRSYRVPTIVSETTMKESSGILFRTLDVVQVKGKHNKTKIFEPICKEANADRALRSKLNEHQQAMDLYFSEDWNQAQASFKLLEQKHVEDLYYPAILGKIQGKIR